MGRRTRNYDFWLTREYGGAPVWMLIGVALVLVGVAWLALTRPPEPEYVAQPRETPSETPSPTPTATVPLHPVVADFREWVAADSATTYFIAAGDSTRDDEGPAPFYFERLREDMPELPPENIVSVGRNGATLEWLLDDGGWLAEIEATTGADGHAVVEISVLTNDVRLGALGTTVDEIEVAGSARLQEAIDALLALPNPPDIMLTVPAPYLVDGEYIEGVDPQVATEGVRAAFIAAAAANPDVLFFDAQAELFGTTTDRAFDGDQLHPGITGQNELANAVAMILLG